MTREVIREVINELKKYTVGKKNAQKTEISVLALNRLIFALEEQEPKTGHCKDCKYFEYDSVANVDGIPLIVAHEICNKWGDGCKTKGDGYCFLFEPRERSGEE